MAESELQPVELFLTCGSVQEAQQVVDELLQRKLIACAEMIPIQSKFLWKGEHQTSDEIKLIMHSAAHLFERVEAAVASLHSYETFVLLAVPITHISESARLWLESAVQ